MPDDKVIVSGNQGWSDDFAEAAKILATKEWPPPCGICGVGKGTHWCHRDAFGFFRFSITAYVCDQCVAKGDDKPFVKELMMKRRNEVQDQAKAQLKSGDKSYLNYFRAKYLTNVAGCEYEGKNWLKDWVNENIPELADQITLVNCELCHKAITTPEAGWSEEDQMYHIYCSAACRGNNTKVILS